jgi:hypothetical protein
VGGPIDVARAINLLADLTKKTGKTIIMTIHQPAKDEFEKFNLAFIMGYGGIPTYFGPTGSDSYRFFGSIIERPGSPYRAAYQGTAVAIETPRDMFDMLNVRERATHEQMKQRDPNTPRAIARLESAKQWRAEFFQNQNPVFQKMYAGRRAVGTEPAARGTPARASTAMLRQLTLLMSRYWKVKIRDRAGAAIMFLQAPVIGIMLAFVFGGQKSAIPFWCLGALQELAKKSPQTTSGTANLLSEMQMTTDHTAAMFFVVVSCVWFGTSNAAREIVSGRLLPRAPLDDRSGDERRRARPSALDDRRLRRSRDGADTDRAHPSNRAGRTHGADDHEPDAQAAHVHHAGALGLRGIDLAGAIRHQERRRVVDRFASAHSVQPARLHPKRALSMCSRANRE